MSDSNNSTQNEKNQSNNNNSNYELLMKSVNRKTAAKMRSITEGFSLVNDANVADKKDHSHR